MKQIQTHLNEFPHPSVADSGETTPVAQSETNHPTTESEAVLVTDGGERPPSYEAAARDLEVVREYSANGSLKVFRDGTDYLVYCRSDNPAYRQTLRVDADQSTPAVGDQIWGIPDNWCLQYHDRLDDGGRCRVYAIQGDDQFVRVSVPQNCQIRDAWFRVEAVGDLVVEYNGNFSKEVVENTLPSWSGQEHIPGSSGEINSEDIIGALETLLDQWDKFETASLEWFETEARETFDECVSGSDTMSLTNGEFYPDIDFTAVSYTIEDLCAVDYDVASEVTGILIKCEALSESPTARAQVI
jgi:hypothetical protein